LAARASEPRLDPLGERAELRHSLHFVVRELDAEVLLEAREQVERLKAVDPELAEEIVVGRELGFGDLEVRGREAEDLVEGLVRGSHGCSHPGIGVATRSGPSCVAECRVSRMVSLTIVAVCGPKSSLASY